MQCCGNILQPWPFKRNWQVTTEIKIRLRHLRPDDPAKIMWSVVKSGLKAACLWQSKWVYVTQNGEIKCKLYHQSPHLDSLNQLVVARGMLQWDFVCLGLRNGNNQSVLFRLISLQMRIAMSQVEDVEAELRLPNIQKFTKPRRDAKGPACLAENLLLSSLDH